MDREQQQVQFKFLEEAEDCYDKIEGILLGLATTAAESKQLDEALRASHSVKGGAAMMGLMDLSKVAHRLEDFFKILRVHFISKTIETEVETLLLQGVDCLRQVGNCYKQGKEIDTSWIAEHISPVFEQLHIHLGVLTDEDENALLNVEEEELDPALLMFEEGVEAILDRVEGYFATLSVSQQATELAMTAEELVAFGHMAKLAPFIQLCQSIQELATQVVSKQILELSSLAFKTWRRSHALVVRRSFEKLPHELPNFTPTVASRPELDLENALELIDLSALQTDFDNFEIPSESSTEMLPDAAMADLAETLATDLPSPEPLESVNLEDIVLDDLAIADLVETLSVELPALDPELDILAEKVAENCLTEDELEVDAHRDLQDSKALADLQQMFEFDADRVESMAAPEGEAGTADLPLTLESAAQLLTQATATRHATPPVKPLSGKTVRVPVERLEQFNTLFGKLVLERNTVNMRFEQLRAYAQLIRQRIRQLEASNTQLQHWYDRASIAGVIPTEAVLLDQPQQVTEVKSGAFDALEMDQYSELHLIAQAQIETIVQLQEVGSDINLTLQDMGQAVRDLNQTTRSLQTNVTRTQMVPFQAVIKRFPRVIRDLSVQFNKPVNLIMEGDATLIDRSVLEALGDTLNHLLRNAFDHGIDGREGRVSMGKAPQGTITIKARNRGAQTVITLSDDGVGIQFDKVRERLQHMGLPETEILQMSDQDLLECIFEPGFSTAAKVTEVSGRGIGLDVVRTTLRQIRGDLHVQTKQNVGTTFTIRVPYTLSIVRVMILEQSGLIFAVPVDNIRELLRLDADQLHTMEQSRQLIWQDQSIPVINLAKHWTFNRTRKFSEMLGAPVINHPTVLVVGEDNTIGGLEIERFWGEQEVTIRNVASPLPMPPGFVSSTVLGDGRVVPIVDPLPVFEWSLEREQSGSVVSGAKTPSPVYSDNAVLVVDDSVNVRRFLALTLEKAGYQIEQAKDGQEAVDKLESGLRVQAVICDIEMPRLDGYGLLEEVKGQPQFADLPIIMLTSRSHDKHRRMAMNLGASAYFSKPFNEQELLDVLATVVTEGTPELVR